MTRSARRRHQYAVDLPGYVALETADDLPLALALRGAPRALCSDIGPLHLLSSGEGRVGHSEPHGAMLERSHRGSGPISLTTALGARSPPVITRRGCPPWRGATVV